MWERIKDFVSIEKGKRALQHRAMTSYEVLLQVLSNIFNKTVLQKHPKEETLISANITKLVSNFLSFLLQDKAKFYQVSFWLKLCERTKYFIYYNSICVISFFWRHKEQPRQAERTERKNVYNCFWKTIIY